MKSIHFSASLSVETFLHRWIFLNFSPPTTFCCALEMLCNCNKSNRKFLADISCVDHVDRSMKCFFSSTFWLSFLSRIWFGNFCHLQFLDFIVSNAMPSEWIEMVWHEMRSTRHSETISDRKKKKNKIKSLENQRRKRKVERMKFKFYIQCEDHIILNACL